MKTLKISFILAGAWLGGSLMGVEEPQFEVKQTWGEVEVRSYGPMVVAQTLVTGNFSDAGNEGFKKLAGYIFGGNQGSQKIEMTAPVIQEPQKKGEKIEMTAPVLQEGAEQNRWVSFVMPAGRTLENLPRPNDPAVVLKEIPARKMAVLRYSGTWSEERYQEKVQALLEVLKTQGVKLKGAPTLARYNPPWIPWFLRRNEVQIEIE